MKVLGRDRPVEAESSVYKCNNRIILNENLDLFADINIIQVSNLTKLQG